MTGVQFCFQSPVGVVETFTSFQGLVTIYTSPLKVDECLGTLDPKRLFHFSYLIKFLCIAGVMFKETRRVGNHGRNEGNDYFVWGSSTAGYWSQNLKRSRKYSLHFSLTGINKKEQADERARCGTQKFCVHWMTWKHRWEKAKFFRDIPWTPRHLVRSVARAD